MADSGVIVGLVTSAQTNSVLMSRTSIWQCGLMAVIPDEHWREWVDNVLQTASLSIIDSTVATDSVLWEIQTASRLMPPNDIAILKLASTEAPVPSTEVRSFSTLRQSRGFVGLQMN